RGRRRRHHDGRHPGHGHRLQLGRGLDAARLPGVHHDREPLDRGRTGVDHVRPRRPCRSHDDPHVGASHPRHGRRQLGGRGRAGPGQTGVSARVLSTARVQILVERPFYFRRDIGDTGRAYVGAHVAPGSQPGGDLFFAEGTLIDGFNEFLTLFNPSTTPADVEVRYLLEGAPSQTRTYTVGGGARRTIQVY